MTHMLTDSCQPVASMCQPQSSVINCMQMKQWLPADQMTNTIQFMEKYHSQYPDINE